MARKTEEKEGGSEDTEVKADMTDGGKGLHGMVTSREEGREGSSTLVPETSAVRPTWHVRPRRKKVAARTQWQRGKDI